MPSSSKPTDDAISGGNRDRDVHEQDRLCTILVPKRMEHLHTEDRGNGSSVLATIALDTHCRVALSEPGLCCPRTGCRFAFVHGQPWDIQRCVAKLVCAFHELGQSQGTAVASATIVVPDAQVWRVTGRRGHLQQQLAKSTRCLISIDEPVGGAAERMVSVTGKLPDMVKAARVICRRILTHKFVEANADQCSMPPDELKPTIPRKMSATISSLALEPGTPSHTPSTAASPQIPFFGLSPNAMSPRKIFSSKLSPGGSFPTTPSIPEATPYAGPEQQAIDHGAAPFASLM